MLGLGGGDVSISLGGGTPQAEGRAGQGGLQGPLCVAGREKQPLTIEVGLPRTAGLDRHRTASYGSSRSSQRPKTSRPGETWQLVTQMCRA